MPESSASLDPMATAASHVRILAAIVQGPARRTPRCARDHRARRWRQIRAEWLRTRAAPAIVGREIRAAEERLTIGRQEHGHGPSAASGGGLNEQHVDAVDVRPLLAIHFYGDEIFIEDARDLLVFERLALHHVAPVAGRVSDRQKDRLVFARGRFERLVAPGIPVHWIVRVLEEVGTLSAGQVVGHMDVC